MPAATTTTAAPSALDSRAFKALNAGLAASTCQPGQEGARVGLLPGLRPEYMQRYEKEEKKRRAPREDLSTLTAEEKVERRKARARVYSHHARKRDEAKMQALAEDVDMMQVFRHIVEDAPDIMAVVSPDLDCSLLYANEAFGRVLGFVPQRLLGRPLWALVHPEDHPALKQAMTTVILAPGRRAISPPLSCRLTSAMDGKYVGVEAKMSRGTQGVVCCFGEKA
jgi:PAS domain S-box-containing protein